jgi:hypothetical protein
MRTVSGFRVFDEMVRTQEQAERLIEGWEHKECVTPIHALLDIPLIDWLNSTGRIPLTDVPFYSEDLKTVKEEEDYYNNEL